MGYNMLLIGKMFWSDSEKIIYSEILNPCYVAGRRLNLSYALVLGVIISIVAYLPQNRFANSDPYDLFWDFLISTLGLLVFIFLVIIYYNSYISSGYIVITDKNILIDKKDLASLKLSLDLVTEISTLKRAGQLYCIRLKYKHKHRFRFYDIYYYHFNLENILHACDQLDKIKIIEIDESTQKKHKWRLS